MVKRLNKSEQKRFERKTIGIWAGMKFTVGVRRVLIMAMALVYFVSIGINVFWITTLFAVASLIALFMEFPTGAVADYDSRKKSLMIGYLLFTFAYFGIFLVSSFWIIAIFWIISEIAWTFCTGAGGAWVLDNLNVGKEKRGIVRLISKGFLFQKAGFLVGGLIGFFVIALNFRLIWLVGGVLYLVLFLLMWKYGEERNFKPEKAPAGYAKKTFMKAMESYRFLMHSDNRNKRVLLLASFFGTMVWSVFWIGMPLMFIQTLGLSPENLSGLQGVFAILTLAVPLFIKKNSIDKGFKKYLFWTVLINALAVILFGFSNLLIYGIIFLGLATFLSGIMQVVIDSASHYYSDSKIRASLGSIDSINYYIANAIGVFFGGIGFVTIGVPKTLIIVGLLVPIQGLIYLAMREN